MDWRTLKSGELWSLVASTHAADLKANASFQIASFNVERAYHAEEQRQYLQQFDIVLLQEVDLGCKRTGSRNNLEVLAGKDFHGVFAVEFEEIDSPLRSAHLAGGGTHGNAILSKWPIVACGVVIFETCPYDWSKSGSQPRKGSRNAVWADIVFDRNRAPMRVYSAHMENYCGAIERLSQLLEIVRHFGNQEGPLVVGGDFNTLMHGVTRFMPFIYPAQHWKHRFFFLLFCFVLFCFVLFCFVLFCSFLGFGILLV